MSQEKQVKVLVVDDEPSIRVLVQRALERNGFYADVASDGVEALGKLESEAFDLLILDLMMPRLNGFDVVEKLARNPNGLPKILVMTAASPSVLHDLPVHRVEKIITKPFEVQHLVASAMHLAASANGDAAAEETPPGGKR